MGQIDHISEGLNSVVDEELFKRILWILLLKTVLCNGNMSE